MGRKHEDKVHNRITTLDYKHMKTCSTSVKPSNKIPIGHIHYKFKSRAEKILQQIGTCLSRCQPGFNRLHTICSAEVFLSTEPGFCPEHSRLCLTPTLEYKS